MGLSPGWPSLKPLIAACKASPQKELDAADGTAERLFIQARQKIESPMYNKQMNVLEDIDKYIWEPLMGMPDRCDTDRMKWVATNVWGTSDSEAGIPSMKLDVESLSKPWVRGGEDNDFLGNINLTAWSGEMAARVQKYSERYTNAIAEEIKNFPVVGQMLESIAGQFETSWMDSVADASTFIGVGLAIVAASGPFAGVTAVILAIVGLLVALASAIFGAMSRYSGRSGKMDQGVEKLKAMKSYEPLGFN